MLEKILKIKQTVFKIENWIFSWKQYLLFRHIVKTLLKDSQLELDLLKDSFFELFKEIERYKPDAIVFLDVGARIFGLSIMKAMRVLNLNANIHYINLTPTIAIKPGDELKNMNVFLEAFKHLNKYKKILFIDETFHKGNGLARIKIASEILKFDFIYFALSKTRASKHTDKIPYARIMDTVVDWHNNFPACNSLALRELGRLYVTENMFITIPLKYNTFPSKIFHLNCVQISKMHLTKMVKLSHQKAHQAQLLVSKKIEQFVQEYKSNIKN